jgi:ABC-type lipoprotein export system ATPase subunit
MTKLFPKGSEWRKWDLHIHTPASFHWQDGKRFCKMAASEKNDVLQRLIERLNQSDSEVFGIMDYWTFDGYFELIQFLQNNPSIECHKTILPGMELRVEAPVDFRLNIHVLLSNQLTRQNLLDFKSSLLIRIQTNTRPLSDEALVEFAKSLDDSKARYHGYSNHRTDEEKCLELGSKTAEITRDCLKDAQSKLPKGSCLVILPYDTSDGLLKLDWKAHPQADNYFMQSAHIFETRDFDNVDLFLGRETDKNREYIGNFLKTMGGKPKPVVSGSDAHKISDYGVYPSDKATWIKSDPTFDGLKYTVYDPSERVCISPNHPDLEFPKPFFNKIEIQESLIFPSPPAKKIKFTATQLELNSGLIAIIGGRGTGKSILLDAIAKTFNKPKNKDRVGEISMQGGFSVEYSKNTGEIEKFEIGSNSEVIYLHVHQREVQEIVKDPEFLSNAILEMLGASTFLKDSSEENIDEILCQIKECKEWLEEHNKDKSQVTISRRTQLISTITTERNKQLIEAYGKNTSSIKAAERHIDRLSSFQTRLNQVTQEVNDEVEAVNNDLGEEKSIPSVSFDSQLGAIQAATSSLNSSIKNWKQNNTEIQSTLESEKIEGDPFTLLQKVSEYRSEIEREEEILRQISQHENQLKSLIEKRNSFVDQLNIELKNQVDYINEKWNEKSQGKPEWNPAQIQLTKDLLKPISICGEIYFNVDEFYRQVETCLDLRKFRYTQQSSPSSRVRSTIRVCGYEDYKKLVGNFPILKLDQTDGQLLTLDEFLEQDLFNANGYDSFLELLFSKSKRQNYLKVLAKIKYDNKIPEELSIGQRGTLYLCLKLATESFFDPIIIDQPEDDLDNDFIMTNLVPIFSKIKKYRQVIIVTHNANLVINADAEQVIVADNNSEKLSYISGSLENSIIREKICNVLEGGKEAFIKREQKYGLSRA